ncbi:MAG TPA: hypothetical protein VGR16_09725 [Thermomicrobiales bacterium]|nr:hypothetical protein [Thermomicrobiales bacterium]
MARYLVIHAPAGTEASTPDPPTRMEALAREMGAKGATPRWLTAWSPDLHDDRIFTLWEADRADDILQALRRYGFLSHMSAQALRVNEWGPADVLAAHAES